MLITLGVSLTLGLLTSFLLTYDLSTLAVDHAAVRGWLTGDDLYAYRAPRTQAAPSLPPALAMLLVPLALVPLPVAGCLLALTGVGALFLALRVLTTPLARLLGYPRLLLALIATALALVTEPVRACLGSGRADVIVFTLVIADLVALRRADRSRWWPAAPRPVPPQSRAATRRFVSLDIPTSSQDPTPAGFRFPAAGAPSPSPTSATSPPRPPTLDGAWPTAGQPGARFPSVPLGSRLFPSGPVAGMWFTFGPLALRRPAVTPRETLRCVVHRLQRAWAEGGWAGVGTGVAAALAITPVLFIPGLLLFRRRRAGLVALVTATLVSLAGFAVAPRESMSWFGTALWQPDHAEALSTPVNQSLAGLLARLYDVAAPPVLVWLSFAALLLAVGFIRCRTAYTSGDPVAAFTLVGLTTAVIALSTTPAELVWLVPAVLILVERGVGRYRGGPRVSRWVAPLVGVGAALGYLLLVVPAGYLVGGNVYAIALILVITTLPWRDRETPVKPPRTPIQRSVAIPMPRNS
ncbi:glycosyltransferase 87 family protein [Actinoplanes sp. NPDC051851]|uniref:glycosyltransferase family 87 protein n=1 Tax=Actinoplanes sp. NPDC051851 TaxID=3154753 RepID=UPI00342149C7